VVGEWRLFGTGGAVKRRLKTGDWEAGCAGWRCREGQCNGVYRGVQGLFLFVGTG
jgi:hypothetical protein